MTHLDFLNLNPAYIALKGAIKDMAQSQEPARNYFEPQEKNKLYQTMSGIFALDDSVALLDLFDSGMTLNIELEGNSSNVSWQKLSTLGAWALEYDAGQCLATLHAKGLDLLNTKIDKNFGCNLSMAVAKKGVACVDYMLTQKNNTIEKTDVGLYGQYLLTDLLSGIGPYNDNRGIELFKRFLSVKVPWSMFTSQEHYYERRCLGDDSHNALDYMLRQDISDYASRLSVPTTPVGPQFFSLLIESSTHNHMRLQKIHAFLTKYAKSYSEPLIEQYLNKTQSLIEKNQLNKKVKIVKNHTLNPSNSFNPSKPAYKI